MIGFVLPSWSLAHSARTACTACTARIVRNRLGDEHADPLLAVLYAYLLMIFNIIDILSAPSLSDD